MKKASALNKSQTYDLLGISPDAQPLCCRRLIGAKTIKLVSYCQHPAYCQDWKLLCNDRNVMVNFTVRLL